jgi:hypothetical protein
MTATSNRELPATEALIVSLDEYIRARYGLLAAQTFEEERFIRFMRGRRRARTSPRERLVSLVPHAGLEPGGWTRRGRRTASDSESRGRALGHRVHRRSRAGSLRPQRLRNLFAGVRSKPELVSLVAGREFKVVFFDIFLLLRPRSPQVLAGS